MADTEAQGYYCSTSGTVFADKDALTDHYKSELHRYNLKRKVAGACWQPEGACRGRLSSRSFARMAVATSS